MRTCNIKDCCKSVHGHGLCETHYRRRQRTGSTELSPKQWLNEKGQFLPGRTGDKNPQYKRHARCCAVCKIKLLLIPARTERAVNLFCSRKCKAEWQRGLFGEANPRWKGGRWKDKGGYVYVSARTHPNKTRHGYIFEHRKVMEKAIGRYLRRDEHVHHLNGIKDDNRPENLVITNNRDHDKMSVRHGMEQRIMQLEKEVALLKSSAINPTVKGWHRLRD